MTTPAAEQPHEFNGHPDSRNGWCVVPTEGTEHGYCGQPRSAAIHRPNPDYVATVAPDGISVRKPSDRLPTANEPHEFQYANVSNGLCWCGQANGNPIHRLVTDAPAEQCDQCEFTTTDAGWMRDHKQREHPASEPQAVSPELKPCPRVWITGDPRDGTEQVFTEKPRAESVEYTRTSTASTEDAVAYLESINAPVTEDRILWAKFLATKPTVEQVNLASSLVIEDRTRHGAALAEALRAMVVMMDRGGQPRKLDEALTWRQNDEKARALADAALARWDGKGES